MAFLGPTELKRILANNLIITNGEGGNVYTEKRVEEAAYALSLGTEAYRTDNKDRKIELLDEKSRTIEINPGQFTLLMTDEYVCIPKDKLAFISIKAKQKLKGLINVSGFHVDPGFEGKLLFSVYNAGPSTITLETKKPYFLIWFSNLESGAQNGDEYTSKNHHQGQKHIPVEYVDALKRGDIASPSHLFELIKEQRLHINSEISLMKSNVDTKIKETERKYLNLDYLWKLLIGLLIALFLRWLFLDYSKKDFIIELEAKDSINIKLNQRIDTLEKKILTLHKIDSLINKRLSNKEKQDANK